MDVPSKGAVGILSQPADQRTIAAAARMVLVVLLGGGKISEGGI